MNKSLSEVFIKVYKMGPGGVEQWTSHLPHEQEDPGLNPAKV
jgi:hypothetical protein